jgi:cytochrome b561
VKYHASIRIIHWLVAILVLFMLIFGFVMVDLNAESYPIKWQIYAWHQDGGVIILMLTLLRIIIRKLTIAPPLPDQFSKLVRFSAYLTHYLFYCILIIQPLIGYLMSNFGGHSVHFFGLALPIVVSPNKEFAHLAKEAHETVAITLIFMILLHIAATLKHRYFDKQDVLERIV